MSAIAIPVSPEVIEVIAVRAAEIVLTTSHAATSPWLTRKQAAEYLSIPLSRLEKDRTVPCHRWDGRVFYNRHELDAFVLAFGQA